MQAKALEYYLAALLILLPLGVWGSTVHYGHAHSLIIFAVIGMGLIMPNQWMRLFMYYLAGWLAYATAGLFLGFLTSNHTITAYLLEGSVWTALGAVVFALIYYGRIKNETAFNILCVTAVIQAGLGVAQSFGYNPIFDFYRALVAVTSHLPPNAATGTLGNNNFLAAYVAIALPFFFRRRWCYFLPLLIICLHVAVTTTAAIAAIAGAAYYFYPQVRGQLRSIALAGAAVAGCCIYYAFIYHPIIGNNRPDMWLNGIQKVAGSWQSIMIGYGPAATWKPGDELHSEYVMALFNFGAVGLGLVAAYIVSVFRAMEKIDRRLMAAFVAICIDAIGNHLMHTIPTALIVIAILAMIERGRNYEAD
jgi:hypothetical protein